MKKTSRQKFRMSQLLKYIPLTLAALVAVYHFWLFLLALLSH